MRNTTTRPRKPDSGRLLPDASASHNRTTGMPLGSPALYRLMAWLSPAYPVGAFAYSSGIEWAVEAGDIKGAETLMHWLSTIMRDGGGFCDAVFFIHAHGAAATRDEKSLHAAAELASALAPSKERF